MIVDGVFQLKIGKVVTGSSLWKENCSHKEGDVLTCDTKQWKVVGVDRIFQGCFSVPIIRYHALILEPIGHDAMPVEGDILLGSLPDEPTITFNNKGTIQ